MSRGRKILSYVLSMVAIIAVWAACSLLINSPALPLPSAAFAQFGKELPAMLPHIWISLVRIASAMLIGMVLALPLGLALGRIPKLDAIFAPAIYLLYPIPKVVFLPVLMVLLGLGNAPKIVLIATVIFFQTLVTARDAAKNIPEGNVTSVKSLGASKTQIAAHVILPASLPDVFTALRINTGTAIAILFLAESIAGSTGLGYYISNAWGLIDYSSMFAGIIAMALLGLGLYELINLIEHRLLRWKA